MDQTRILIVDDDPIVFEVVRLAGQMHGYNVIGAGTGESGITEALVQKPDLVVLDLYLPDIDGLEVCRRLRMDPHTKHIPIILMTGTTDKEHMIAGFESGADDYLRKPFDPEELLARARAILMRIRGVNPAQAMLKDHLASALDLHQNGRLEDAERHYQRAIEQDAKNLMAYNNLAILCETQGRDDEAIAYLREALKYCESDDGYRETLERNLQRVKRKPKKKSG